jgi:sodium-dependent dicarboxylate transporter 2/3/5
LAVGLSVGVTSMWISNTAATAMVFPIAMGMIEVLSAGQGERGRNFARSPYATALLLMTAYASSVGGISTPIGTATNVVAMGFFRRPEYFGQPVDFARWSAVGLPASAMLFLGLFLWLRLRAPAGELDLPALRGYLLAERKRLGPWTIGEVNTLLVFLIVVALWVAPSPLALFASPDAAKWYRRHFPEEIVALLAPVLLFLLPVDWKRRRFSLEVSDFRKLDWATMLLFGAGLSLGNLMFRTGLAEWIGKYAFEAIGTRDVWAVTMLAAAGGIVLSEFTSNAATATTLIPVVHALCREANVDPIAPLMAVALGASFGSALPVSTPPNAIVYGSGLIPVRRMIFAGSAFDVLCFVVLVSVLRVAVGWGWTPIG